MSSDNLARYPTSPADVWIVDDVRSHRIALQKLLIEAQEQNPTHFGGPIEFRTFGKAEDAVTALHDAAVERRPLLIIADVMMPDAEDGAYLIHQEIRTARYNSRRPYLLWISAKDSAAIATAEKTLAPMLAQPFWDRWAQYFPKPNVAESDDGEIKLDSETWVTLVDDLVRRQRHREYRELWRATPLEAFHLPTNAPWRDFHAAMLAAKKARLVLLRGPTGTPFLSCADLLHRLRKAPGAPEVVSGTICRKASVTRGELFGKDANDSGAIWRARTGTLLLTGIGDDESFGADVLPMLAKFLQDPNRRFPTWNFSVWLSFTGTVVLGITDAEWNGRKTKDALSQLAELAVRLGAPTIMVPGLGAFPDAVAVIANQLLLALTDGKKRFSDDALDELRQRDWSGGLESLQGFVVQCATQFNLTPIRRDGVRKLLGATVGGFPLPPGFHVLVSVAEKTAQILRANGEPDPNCQLLRFEAGTRGGEPNLAFLYFLTMLTFEPSSSGLAMSEQVRGALQQMRGAHPTVFSGITTDINPSTAARLYLLHTRAEPLPWNWEYWKQEFRIGQNGVQPWKWPAGAGKLRWAPKAGQDGSLTQSQKNDSGEVPGPSGPSEPMKEGSCRAAAGGVRPKGQP